MSSIHRSNSAHGRLLVGFGAMAALATCTVALSGPLAAQSGAPGTLTPKPIKVLVLEANADARVQGGSPTTNFATGDLWLGLPDKTAFLHFPLQAIPAGAAIMEAELLVTFRDSYSEQGPNTIELGGVQGTWSETQVTFSNQPGVAWSNRSRTVSAPGTVSWDVKPALEAWLSGAKPNRGLALRGNGPLKNAFSREAASASDRPRIRIRYVEP